MIGTISEQDRVLRFWNGVKPEIQSGLWRAQLNPEISDWSEVLAQAEIIEISENVAHRREHCMGSSHSCQDVFIMPSFPVPRNNPPSSNLRSSRAMTFDSSRQRNRGASTSSAMRRTPASTRLARSNQSFRPTPRCVSYAKRVSQSAVLPQVEMEPRNSPRPAPAPMVLSKKEKSDLVGKCYLCKEPGHMARNCPQGNKIKSSTGKPPGTLNFNIEFDEVEVLDSLLLGMLEFEGLGAPSNWCASYPDWDQLGARTRPEIGDCYAMMAEYILTTQQPYPGDE